MEKEIVSTSSETYNLRSNSWGIREISGMCSCLNLRRFNMVDGRNRPCVHLATDISHIKFENIKNCPFSRHTAL